MSQDIDSAKTSAEVSYPRFRSFWVDLALAPFMGGVSGVLDVDLVRLPSTHLSTFGVRFAVDRYIFGGPGGEGSGSPALDYDVLIRHTASGSVVRFDIYLGYAYYASSSTGGLKFGLEFRFAIIEHFWAFLAKLSLPAGLGFSAGWEQ
jgi:hypothetical protein